ncbi:MAG: hypothetical protein AB7J40_05765 [Candidatus Altimarinota bacterium]
MKSFQYKAKNHSGQVLEGVIDSQHFAEASSMIQARGLELISLEELKVQMEETMPYLFDAIDAEGEKVQGTIQGTDEDLVKHQLEKDFGYKVSRVYRKDEAYRHEEPSETEVEEQAAEIASESHQPSVAEPSTPPEDSILFQSAPRIIHSKPVIPDEELNEVHESIQLMVAEKGAAISPETRNHLLHLSGMIDLVRENQNKARWKQLRHDIRAAQKIAEREIQLNDDEKWKAYEHKNPTPTVSSYAEFPEKVSHFVKANEKVSKVVHWMQTVDLPNQHQESDVLAKQQYESVWFELQRFSGALVVFYLSFLFVAYYLKRSGVEDNLLIRMYDTLLFKQIMLGVFIAYGFLTVRKEYLNKRVKTDLLIVLLMLFGIAFFIW